MSEVSKESRFQAIAPGVWFASYSPEQCGSLDLHFWNSQDENGIEAFEMRQQTDPKTGATWYTLDGVHHTVESLAALGRFTIPLSDFLFGESHQRWIYAGGNIAPLEAFISARGDNASAQKLRDTFPKLFEPPAAPEPKPAKPKSHWPSRWKWL